jgi:hypothetical protein
MPAARLANWQGSAAARTEGRNVGFEFQTARKHTSAFSRRDSPEACSSFTLVENRGRRESRVPIAPAVVRQKNARVDHRFNRITPAFPARMVYGLLRTLPGEPSSLATVALRMTDASRTRLGGNISTKLDASFGRQDHTTSPSATVSAKGLAGPRTIRRVSSKMGCSAVRPRPGRSLTEKPALQSRLRPTLSRPSHPTARS